MKKTLTTNEINQIVTDTLDRIEAKKGTNALPYIKMDLSEYSPGTVEAIKEAFIASGVRFQDRWNDGSDFVVDVPVESAPEIFRSGRRDAGTVDPRNPMHDSVHVPKTPLNLGRRDSFTKSDGPICEPGQAKKPLNLGRRDTFTIDPQSPMYNSASLESKIQEAASQLNPTPHNNHPQRENER